ncbi:MAG: GNAT family N-acetyltransferase, partial [Chloroflexota bacterium]
MLHFRPFEFTDSDYQTIFDIHLAIWPQSFNTLEGVKYSDEKAQDPKFDFERLVAEWDGQPVGYGSRSRTVFSEVPDQYFLFFNTLPEFRNRGIATAYFDRVE